MFHRTLFQNVLPFWLEHAIDPGGGINTCIADDGTVHSRDKLLWSQWRAVWVFSALHRRFPGEGDWLPVAKHIRDFALRHGWDEAEQGWRMRLSADGATVEGYTSIYVDAFAVYGLTEHFHAAGDEESLHWAKRTADRILDRLRLPHDQIPHAPYPIPPGARVHGIPMIHALVLWELGRAADDDRYRDAALKLTDEIRTRFYSRRRDMILERISADGSEYPPPLGTTVIPGHVVEDMWFQIHIARDIGDAEWIRECCRIMLRHLELGWDTEYGGLFLAIDAEGREEVGWTHPTSKIWWPHTEALYGTLLAHKQTGDEAFLDWHNRIRDYAFAKFPVREHGEWTQNLDRHGNPLDATVCLPVKDPFHLPRALIYCIEA